MREEYARHPERLPPLPLWVPNWVLFPDERDHDLQPLLVEGYQGDVAVHVRIGGDGTKRWAPAPVSGRRDPPGSAEDDLGTGYHVSAASQNGRLVVLAIRPAPPAAARTLRLRVEGAEFSFDLARGRVAVEKLERVPVHLETPRLCAVVSAARALRAARLRLSRFDVRHIPAFESAYLSGAMRALRAAGVLSAEPEPVSRAARQLSGEVLQPVRRAVYFKAPDTAGARLLAAFMSERAITVRWAQLPPAYAPNLRRSWIIPEDKFIDLRLADDRDSPYVEAVHQAGAAGFVDPPRWHGQSTFLTDSQPGSGVLEMAIAGSAAQFSLD